MSCASTKKRLPLSVPVLGLAGSRCDVSSRLLQSRLTTPSFFNSSVWGLFPNCPPCSLWTHCICHHLPPDLVPESHEILQEWAGHAQCQGRWHLPSSSPPPVPPPFPPSFSESILAFPFQNLGTLERHVGVLRSKGGSEEHPSISPEGYWAVWLGTPSPRAQENSSLCAKTLRGFPPQSQARRHCVVHEYYTK